MSIQNASELIAQLRAFKVPEDKAERKKLYNAALEFTASLESPQETIDRVMSSPLITTFSRVGGDLKIFEILVNSKSAQTTQELAKATGAHEVLLRRILRYLSGERLIKEAKEDTFEATSITEALSRPGFQAGIRHCLDAIMPCLQHTPKFLKDTNYQNPADNLNCPFQKAYNTDQPAFVWLMGQPEIAKDFNIWMTAHHDGQKAWLDVVPFNDIVGESDPETPIFVDIGGGIGHQCAALRERLPDLEGRVILQDLPLAIQHAIPRDDVEKAIFDFWGEQPVKGAKAYYLRNILHDYPDEKCITLLKNTSAALGKDSVILIDEIIIPNSGAHSHISRMDLIMMTGLASMERSEKQWQALIGAAGLKIRQTYTYNEDLGESVIIAVPA